jgi:CelD/BcsL family acetyltransferase involved in cellulose biosynthesis
MIIETIETTDQFERLREEWNLLLASSAANCVFLRHEWLFTWWKHLAEERVLFILTARDQGKLVGLLPLALRKPQYARMVPRVLEFLGSGLIGSDYLDAIVWTGFEDRVFSSFGEYLHRRGLVLHLNQLNRTRSLALGLMERLQHKGWTVAETKINVCPYIDLSAHNWDSYLASLSSSHRYNFNRRLRNLEKSGGLHLERVDSSGQAGQALDTVVTLHRKRWGSTGASEAFQTEQTRAFHREFVQLAAGNGWLRLLILSLDQVPVAALYGLHYGSTFYFYQSGFDPAYSKQSVGLVIMGLAIKSAAEEGVREYDFLHGSEDYKFHWTTQVRELGRIELYPPHTRGRIFRHAIDFNRAARKVAGRMLK